MTQGNETQTEERESASVRLSRVDSVRAREMAVSLSAIGRASAEEITVHTGGIVAASGKIIEVTTGGVVLARAEELSVHRGRAVAVSAGKAQLQNARVGLLLAREVHGDVRVLLDRQSVAIWGLAAGLLLGLIHLLSGNRKR